MIFPFLYVGLFLMVNTKLLDADLDFHIIVADDI